MSSVLGGNGLGGGKEVYMKLASFGAIQISVTPQAGNPELMDITIGTETRREVVNMTTNKDETVDQFCQRLRSMMRAQWNGEARKPVAQEGKDAAGKDAKKELTWDEQKAALEGKGKSAESTKTEAKK